jgi:hypothetical protein
VARVAAWERPIHLRSDAERFFEPQATVESAAHGAWVARANAASAPARGGAHDASDPSRNAIVRNTVVRTARSGWNETKHRSAGRIGEARHPSDAR